MKKRIKHKTLFCLVCVMVASILLAFVPFGGNYSVSAGEDYNVKFYAANAVVMGSKSPSYLYCDVNESESHDDKSTEAWVYCNNRFNPARSNDVALVWTAPEEGVLNAVANSCNIVLNKNGTRTAATPDGIRFAVIKLSGYACTFAGDYHAEWTTLEYKAGEQTQADYASSIANVALKKGESVAIAINCGTNANADLDEAVISASFGFTSNGGQTSTYTFNGSWLTAQGNALNNKTEYALFTQATEYFGWGALVEEEDYSKMERPSETKNELFQVEDYAGIYFYDGNAVIMGSQAPSYVYYDADGNGKHASANEPYVYVDNRFTPTNTSDVGLWWTAPEKGKATINENALVIALNEKLRESETPDGIYFAIVKASANGKVYPLTVNMWNPLGYIAKTKTAATTGKIVCDLEKDDKIAIVINCGGAGNNAFDEATIYEKIVFTSDEGTAKTYTFKSSWIAEQGQAIFDGKEYALNGESTGYFGWGKVYLNKERETFSTDNAYSFGEVQATPMGWNGQRWYGNSICVAYPDKVSETSGKYPWIRMQPDFGKNVAAIFTATEDCKAAITRLHLAKSGQKNIRNADGVRWAIVYKTTDVNGEAKYYSVNDTVWTHHEFDGRYGETIIKTHTDFPNVTMKSGDQLMLVFDNNKVTGYDTIAVQIDLQYVLPSGELKTCNLLDEVKPNDTMTYEHWSFAYLKMGQDYSDTVIGEVDNVEFESVGTIELKELSYDIADTKWLSYEYPDISVYSKDNLYYLTPDENRAVAVALKIGKAGRIMFDEDSYIRLDSAGSSNGVRLRILKNDEIIYPSQNGWKYTRNENKLSISGMPVLEIGEDDVIYFVLDAFGDSSSDATECNFVVHFAEGTDDYTESYIFSDSYAETSRNGWAYYAINFVDEPYSGVVNSSSGLSCSSCSSSVDVGTYVIVPLLAVFATVTISRKRRKLK